MLRWCYWAGLLLACWLAMQAVHEVGHVVGGLAGGGRIDKVVLHPLAISRTDVTGDRWPLLTVWAGPLLGVAIPAVLWSLAVWRRGSLRSELRFWCGFCAIANGAYLGVGSFSSLADAGELLRLGAPAWTLWTFGAVTVGAGLRLWHGLGPELGLGPHARPITRAKTLILWTTLLVFALVAACLSPRV